MNIEEFKKEMEKNKNNPTPDTMSLEEKRERAMQAYLDDVVPISKFINESFKRIESEQLEEKEGNSDGS